MAPAKDGMNEIEKDIYDRIAKNDVNGLKNILLQHKIKVDIFDENGMTPLQHAAYKGNKEIVQMLLDQVMSQIIIQDEFVYVGKICLFKYTV